MAVLDPGYVIQTSVPAIVASDLLPKNLGQGYQPVVYTVLSPPQVIVQQAWSTSI